MTLTVTSRRVALVAVATVALLAAYLVGASRPTAASAAPTAAAAGTTTVPGITVVGSGTVSGTPDTLHLDLRVSARGKDVSAALAGANRTASDVQAALSKAGVDAKDMQTSGLSIRPDYGNDGKVVGYLADESLSVTLRDLGTAGATITSAVAAGGDRVRIDGLSVGLDSTSALASGARTRAVEDARTRATQYAEAAGRTLGAVESITESVQAPGFQPYAADTQALRAAVPIQAGSQDVVVTVTVVYAFA